MTFVFLIDFVREIKKYRTNKKPFPRVCIL